MSTVGGDDVGAVVVDIGAWMTRAGNAGDDAPRAVIPSAVGYRLVDEDGGIIETTNTTSTEAASSDANEASKQRASDAATEDGAKKGKTGLRAKTPYVGDAVMNNAKVCEDVAQIYTFQENGTCSVTEWDVMEEILRYCVKDHLKNDVSKHPLLIIEPAVRWNSETRTKTAERVFEGLGSPACFLARGAVMSTFASARSTALVGDIGAQGTSCVPVVEGYVLEKAAQFSSIGGNFLTNKLRSLVMEKLGQDSQLYAMHELSRKRLNDKTLKVEILETPKNRTEAHQSFYRSRLLDDMKASLCRLPILADHENQTIGEEGGDQQLAGSASKSAEENLAPVSYELPDGNVIEFSPAESASVPEMLFSPPESHSSKPGVAQMTFDAASACDVDARRELFSGLILTGGSSLFPGVTERFQRDMALLTPQMFKNKIIAATPNHERLANPWIGGSILASLGTFHQMWMSKREYEEFGSNFILRRCP